MNRVRALVQRRLLVMWAEPSRGLGLVEVLIALSLTVALSAMLFSSVMGTAKVVEKGKDQANLTEEARLMLDRMSRELRQARAITSVANPAGLGYQPTVDTSITFEVDFNGNGTIEPSGPDPEVLTYRYDATAQRVLLLAAGQTVPILAGNVAQFELSFSGGGRPWNDLDADPTAGGNGNGLLDTELGLIDTVGIRLVMSNGGSRQAYQTTVDLRNLTR